MNEKLKVTYDTTLKLMQVSPSVWQAIGPMQWFDDYRIISTGSSYFRDDTRVIDLTKFHSETGKVPTKIFSILSSPVFQKVVADMHLEDYKLILARPTSLFVRQPTLSNDSAVASKFENKVWLRQYFDKLLNFPPFVIVPLHSLREGSLSDFSQRLNADGLIIQDATLSGGRGTYSITTDREYNACIDSLRVDRDVQSAHDLVVVSKRLTPMVERTLQVCLTDSAIYVGPVQAQLLSDPLLVSDQPGDIQFCGGRIAPGLVTDVQREAMRQAAHSIGKELQARGYRGILGVDFIISDNQVYPIEVNPRLTGLSLLLAYLQQEVPYLLLHILELANSTYDVTVEPAMADQGIQGSFIQVYAQEDGICTLRSGVYNGEGSRLTDAIEGGGIIPKKSGEYFVAMRVEPGQRVRQGKSLAFIYSHEQLFDDENGVSPAVAGLIRRVRT